MTGQEIIKSALEETGYTRSQLGKLCGYSSHSAITEILHRDDVRLKIFSKLLSAMNYEVVVRNKDTKTEWIVDDKS